MKICPRCKENVRDTYHSYCRSCRSESQKEYNKKYLKNPDNKKIARMASKRWHWNKNGFTEEIFNNFFNKQGNKCGICGSLTPSKNNKNDWHGDHDHNTGKPRGVLCAGCNTLLGRLESVGFDWVDKAKKYLNQ